MSVKVNFKTEWADKNNFIFYLNEEKYDASNLEEAVNFYIAYQYTIDSTNAELGITNKDCDSSGCVRNEYQVIENFHDFVKNNNLVDHYKSTYSFKEFFDIVLTEGDWWSNQECYGTVLEYATAVEQAIKIGYEIVPLYNSPKEVDLSSYHWEDLGEKELNDENFKKALNLFKKLFKNDVKDWYSHEFSCVEIYENLISPK